MLTPEKIQKLKSLLPYMSADEKRETLSDLARWEKEMMLKVGQNSLLSFADHVYPGYKVGPHHKRLAKIFEDIANGKKKRVIVNIAPRHGKSELISYLAPAWFLGKYPHKKIIMASHTADLAVNFGRRVRNLVNMESYRDIFHRLNSSKILNQLLGGGQTLMVNILLSVWVALWLDAVLICLLLTTLILNKKLSKEDRTYFYLLGSGFSLVLFNVLCLVGLLLLL